MSERSEAFFLPLSFFYVFFFEFLSLIDRNHVLYDRNVVLGGRNVVPIGRNLVPI